jgi:hypothetical protein
MKMPLGLVITACISLSLCVGAIRALGHIHNPSIPLLIITITIGLASLLIVLFSINRTPEESFRFLILLLFALLQMAILGTGIVLSIKIKLGVIPALCYSGITIIVDIILYKNRKRTQIQDFMHSLVPKRLHDLTDMEIMAIIKSVNGRNRELSNSEYNTIRHSKRCRDLLTWMRRSTSSNMRMKRLSELIVHLSKANSEAAFAERTHDYLLESENQPEGKNIYTKNNKRIRNKSH